MNNSIFKILAHIKAKVGKEDLVRKELLQLVELTRNEPGCIKYDLHISNEDPTEFLFYEHWRSKEDLKLHFETDHIKRISSLSDQLLAEPTKISSWTQIA